MNRGDKVECIKIINDLKVELDMLKDALRDCRDEREYRNLERVIKGKEEQLDRYKTNMAKLSDNQIEYRIYLKLLNGLTPTRAVEEVAEENYLRDVSPTGTSQIWNKYYKNLKKIIAS